MHQNSLAAGAPLHTALFIIFLPLSLREPESATAHKYTLCLCLSGQYVACVNCHSSVTAETGGLQMHHDICLVGRRKHVDWRCQNVTKLYKQGLVPSQLTGRAERKTNRQEMVDRQEVVVEVDTYTQINNGKLL